MQNDTERSVDRKAYSVWDRTTRWFHWINVVCVIGLTCFGLAILNAKLFGVSADGKILLKTLHSYVGYLFAINVAWRMLWAFIGTVNARWKAILPMGPDYIGVLKRYVRGLKKGDAPGYLGHNPLGRLVVTLLFLALFTQAITGLVLAGTDLYQPPFGGMIAEWVTEGDAEKLAKLTPGSKKYVDLDAYEEMRSFRKPVITTHLYAFYVLMLTIFLHITGVVVTEVREKNAIVSAMFSGEKVFSKPPVDIDSTPAGKTADPNQVGN